MPTAERKHPVDRAAAARHARDKLAYARVWLLRHKPFFGVLARAFQLETSAAVTGFRLLPDDRVLFNPAPVLAMRMPALCARLAHLSLHAALGAHFRRGEREPRRWNVAHDLAIMPLLDAAGLSVGAAPGISAVVPGASAESIYRALVPEIAPDPMWADLSEAIGAPALESQPPPTNDERERDTRGDLQGRELDWKLRLAAALEEEERTGGATFGTMPAWLDEFLRATLEPPISFAALLQQSIHVLERTNRSYLRPSRRMSALAAEDGSWPELVTMPGRRIAHGGHLVAVIDTSASLPTDTLARFFGALVSAATAEGIDELRVLQADSAVTRDETVTAADLLFRKIAISGRGGTDFAPALLRLAEDAARDRTRFTVAYLSDLDGRIPTGLDLRLLDVLWVVPRRPAIAPPFGRVIEL